MEAGCLTWSAIIARPNGNAPPVIGGALCFPASQEGNAMGLFGKLLGKDKPIEAGPVTAPGDCVHGVRVPHWDSVEDMGHDERATYFVCESCGQHFTPSESAAIHAGIAAVADHVDQ
jgi:hypothetical protein